MAAACGMEVDPPPVSTSSCSLKRSNSAPMINVLVSSASPTLVSSSLGASTSAISIQTPPCITVSASAYPEPRIRRFSTSSMALHSPTARIQTPVKTRLIQIKQEETSNLMQREAAHEREVQMTQQIYRGLDNLAMDESHQSDICKRPKSLGEPLHIQTCLFNHTGSPSPTRGLMRQCFSPSLQQSVAGGVLSPTPSPSPTRKTFRRSASPITLRPSPLGIKRKMDMDWNDHCSPKRLHSSPHSHNLHFSASTSTGEHPDQRVPAFPTPTHPPPLPTSASPPCYLFRNLRDSIESNHGTDSEASDMTEVTDASSEPNSANSSVNMTSECMRPPGKLPDLTPPKGS
ncbi:hypothetical protein CAPTEDRAFT_226106 [Capitella teleta]|uniref:Uncharacterized protein n=1 Tax=Capitella teleta TaxID=283909 RepID=R7UYB8_CAPTE|nr:hypothetical protein CAPTEDRAFT_226106 [Capitella teleta]|eukprot:ELU11304.1 hypothetical protein CAPTEDRAFT_226106 [Capitella teleta]